MWEPEQSILNTEVSNLEILLYMQGSESGYRAVISKAIPGIKILNLVPLEQEKMDVSDGGLMSQSTLFSVSDTGTEKDWHILQSSIKQGLQMGEESEYIETSELTDTFG